MGPLEAFILLMILLVAFAPIAEKIQVSYPILLVLVGLAVGSMPGAPVINLDPSVVFLIFLPPLLYRAAYKASWHDLKRQKTPITRLAVGLVLFSIAGISYTAHALFPSFSWAEAALLGAILSPPDAIAALNAAHSLRLPRRIVAILEGEGMVSIAPY